ncbi:WD repeat-containing protein 16 [Fasciolopsis buskii]|uniref:Cilia- and flagella-associated protein 52 n=1 Tax=Fasciolopsis buskii TaxID=27845 RepID=A0A8E0VFX9_9TREM|nr:WD repeat-containing protein 16 [Fasciolopsis buski]
MGYKASIIVWKYETREQYAIFSLHKVKVQSLSFSPNSVYLASLGGQDDGSIVIWSVKKKEAICGSPAQHQSAGVTLTVSYSNCDEESFCTAGENTIRIWKLDLPNRKIRPVDCAVGQIKRTILCVALYPSDEGFFCGTSTGDILAISMKTGLLQLIAPEKDKYSLGVTSITTMQDSVILIGTGDGVVQELNLTYKKEGIRCFPSLTKTKKLKKVLGSVSSITLRGDGHQFFVTTDKCHLYRFNYSDFSHELINTCHYAAVNDIRFPKGCSELFATCSYQDVRVFNTTTQQELLRINIPNMTCYCLDLLADGTAIVSGWDDSKIRAFYPETGRLMFTIQNAHKKGVTALCSTSTCNRLISGGGEGQVRVWDITEVRPPPPPPRYGRPLRRNTCSGDDKGIPESSFVTKLVEAMHEHTNAVSCIQISRDDLSCVSASADSTCIIWCLETFHRKQIIFSNTLFRCICYHPNECQVITSGTDRKIGYWEVYDGSLIRQLDGSRSGSINGMDITQDGNTFVTGGDDKLVKIWKYNEGEVTHVGLGHTSSITRLRIAPDQRHVITVSEDGAIYIWNMP